jgi:hypothetical protein
MESYIVRIYRRNQNDAGEVAGLVETVGTDLKRPFQSFSGLVNAMRHAIGNGEGTSVTYLSSGYKGSEGGIKEQAG